MKKILLCLILVSCSRIEKHGYMFDLSDHQMVQQGVTSKDKVIKMMGSPTFTVSFNDEVWVYYAEELHPFLFFIPRIADRQILALSFDDAGLVKEIRAVDLNHETRELEFASNQTIVEDHQRGLFKSLFSNVGQVKAQ